MAMMLLSALVAGAQTEEDFQQVFFRVGSASLNVESIPQSLVDSALAVCARGEKYTVLGVASPEGRYKSNVRLANRRAQAIIKGLRQRTGLPDSVFKVQTLVADMAMLRDLVAQDLSLPCRDQVMEVLSAGDATGATLAKLKRIGDGTPYLYIKDRLFPYLRTSVTSDKDQIAYRPSLASSAMPLITERDYQAYKNGFTSPTAPSAVTSSDQSRHLSSQGGDTIGEKVVEEEDSVLDDTPPEPVMDRPSDTSMLPYWLVILGVVLLMLLLVFFVKWKSTRRLQEQLAHAQEELEAKDEQLRQAEEQLKQKDAQLRDREEQLAQANSQLSSLRENLDKIKNDKTELYNDGEALYNHLMIGGITYEWTNEQIRTLIEYYKLQNYPLIHSLQTDYDNLPLNHILFEILVNMGKSDQEIQRMMNISQTTIRSYRFRIKNKKL